MPTSPFDLTHFEHCVADDPEILGLLYTGSLGHGTADRFSDLDIVVWLTDAAFAACPAKQRHTLTYLGDIQFLYGDPEHATAFVTADWQRVDLAIHRAADFRPDPMYASARLIKDTDGYLASLMARSPHMHFETPPETIRHAISEAVDSQIYLALHNARGAIWSAMGEVSHQCGQLYTLLAQLRGRQSFGFRYVEDLLSGAEQQRLQAVWPREPTQTEVRRAARMLWHWTRFVWEEAEQHIGKPLELSFDEAALVAAVNRIYDRAE